MTNLAKTTREIIINEVIEMLDGTSVQKVIRGRRGNIQKEFLALPDTDFPLIVVDSGLPQPVIKYSSRQQGVIDEVLSSMDMELFVYLRISEGLCGHEDPDVSALIEDLWQAICNKPNIGRVMSVAPSFSSKIVYEGSYCYFTINLKVKYNHDKDSI